MDFLRSAVLAALLLTSVNAAAQTGARPEPPALQRFADQSAFDAYLAELAELIEARDRETEDGIVLVHPPTPLPRSLTDVTPQVDSGDIAKLVGRFLVVLWDGALISVDLRAQGAPGLARTARVDLDRERFNEYSEIISSGDLVVVHNNSGDGANFMALRVERDGVLTLEADFRIAQDDLYAQAYFAGDKLVIVSEMRISRLRGPFVWPELRQGVRRQRMFNTEEVYRPVLSGLNVGLRAVSLCDIDARGEVACATTAAVGESYAMDLITVDAAMFWETPSENSYFDRPSRCDPTSAREGAPAALVRIPLDGGAPAAIAARGDASGLWLGEDGSIRTLLFWCESEQSPFDLRHFEAPQARFEEGAARYRRLPRHRRDHFNLDFGGYLVSAPRGDNRYDVRDLRGSRAATVTFTPLWRGESTSLRLPHDVRRIEIVGDELVFVGYRTGGGLSLSRVSLGGAPRRSASITLNQRYQAMGRDRAYSSLVSADGSGYLALPTWRRETFGEREADVTFIALEPGGSLRDLGALAGRDPKPDAWWEPNSRPYFFDGRFFALNGSEIVEGAVDGGGLREVRRLDFSAQN